jgi:aspartate dehydrogenase
MKMKKIGLIGFGTICKYLYEKLSEDDVEFVFVFSRTQPVDPRIAGIYTNSAEVVARKCEQGVDLVIEAAVFQTVVDLAPVILRHTDMVIFSITALADPVFQKQAEELCKTFGHNLYIPHGAIVGLDGLVDGRAVLKEVTITTTKRPANWGRSDTERTVLYEGPTREICRMYPRNVNVHAATALAGLGFDKTRSRTISDPEALGNTHVIEAKAEGCRFKTEVLSEPISGVTGAYTPVSAYSSIHRILFAKGIVFA